MSALQSLLSVSARTKIVKIADPLDVVSSEAIWSDAQLELDEEFRGVPEKGYRIELKPGAVTHEFLVRRLTSAEREECDAMIRRIQPPWLYEDRPSPNRGEPPIKVRTKPDFEDLEYLRQKDSAERNQLAAICLIAVEGLENELAGADREEKIQTLRRSVDDKIIRYLAGEIWSMTLTAGDPADFFTKANSEATRS